MFYCVGFMRLLRATKLCILPVQMDLVSSHKTQGLYILIDRARE